jgi:RNA polymerase sigma-70 factor (ECF subfamily)
MPIGPHELAGLIQAQAVPLKLWVRSCCAESDDVVQEAFCRLAVQEPAPLEPVAWLYRVSRNLAEKHRLAAQRRRARECARASAEARTATVDPLEVAEAMAAVEQLAPDLREVLVARIWGQLSLEETGRLCGVSTATAQRRYLACPAAPRSAA